MKGKIFRVAHLGYYDYLDTIAVIGALEHVIADLTGKKSRVWKRSESSAGSTRGRPFVVGRR